MTRTISAAACLLFALVPALRAQVYLPQGGIGVQYNGGRLKVSGYYSSGLVVPVSPGGVVLGPPGYLVSPYGAPYGVPYGVMERRVIVQQFAPPPVQRYVPPEPPDVSGIDLDIESPDKLYPPGSALAKKPVARPAEPKIEQPKKPAEELVKPPVVKPEPPAPPMKPPADDLLTPRPD